MKEIIFIVIFIVAVGQVQCTRKSKFEARIQSGEQDQNVLNIAAFITSENVAVCSGALIDDLWVLTAASCFTRNTLVNLRVAFDSGGVDFKSAIRIENAYNHTSFNPNTLVNDLALVKLNRYHDNARPIVIPLVNTNFVGQTVIAKGYGSGNAGSDPGSGNIRRTQTTTIVENNSYCQKYVSMTTTKLCTPDVVACEADIGGLLMTEDSNQLIGIISVTRAHAFQCNRPSVEPYTTYIKVIGYRTWIRKITGIPL